ncbi:MAG: hypothetical protein M0Z40_07880 [Actinomycetota bacterium]|nr:hypothetical protein [Actinomycetota bacterium]MDA8075136.1 hypothetical protein [Actinomycetota bacterium]
MEDEQYRRRIPIALDLDRHDLELPVPLVDADPAPRWAAVSGRGACRGGAAPARSAPKLFRSCVGVLPA